MEALRKNTICPCEARRVLLCFQLHIFKGVTSVSRIMSTNLVILGAGLIATFTYAGGPTMHEVYQAAENGKVAEAHAMIEQVLREHHDSAKARFVAGKLLAREGHLTDPTRELARADTLSPGLPFASPQSVHALQVRLSHSNGLTPSRLVDRSGFLSWILTGGIALFVLMLMSYRPLLQRNGFTASGAAGNALTPPNSDSGALSANPPGGAGSGILGSLTTVAGLGAGMGASDELVHRCLNTDSGTTPAMPPQSARIRRLRRTIGVVRISELPTVRGNPVPGMTLLPWAVMIGEPPRAYRRPGS
jgi:hypothetical protein